MFSIKRLASALLLVWALVLVTGCGEKKDITGDTGENEKYKNELTK